MEKRRRKAFRIFQLWSVQFTFNIKGFNEEIWKEYSHFILDNQESFKDIFENKLENRNNLHHNLLDFSLPMDLGGFGYTYNGDKYSRVFLSQKYHSFLGKFLFKK